MIEIFLVTLVFLSFFVGCLALTLLRGKPISSCHGGGGSNQDCGFCAKSDDNKLKKKILKRARALLASRHSN